MRCVSAPTYFGPIGVQQSADLTAQDDKRQQPCTRQLDFVFVSKPMFGRVRVKAPNEPEKWGLSDHCRIEIDVM